MDRPMTFKLPDKVTTLLLQAAHLYPTWRARQKRFKNPEPRREQTWWDGEPWPGSPEPETLAADRQAADVVRKARLSVVTITKRFGRRDG
jgi:hypothetical protein